MLKGRGSPVPRFHTKSNRVLTSGAASQWICDENVSGTIHEWTSARWYGSVSVEGSRGKRQAP